MPDKPIRPQLNIRLDKHLDLLDEIKQAASDRNTTVSQFILDAILTALGKPTTTTPTDTPFLAAILAEVDRILDAKLGERQAEFERRLLAELRQNSRQPPPEEDRQVAEEARPKTRPDYQAIRDHLLSPICLPLVDKLLLSLCDINCRQQLTPHLLESDAQIKDTSCF